MGGQTDTAGEQRKWPTPFGPGFRWDWYLGWARAALAATAVVAAVQSTPALPLAYPASLAAYALYSLVLAVRGGKQSGAFGLLVLFLDLVVFLVLVNTGTGLSIWLPGLFFLSLISEAVAFYSPPEVTVVVAISLVFCMVAATADSRVLARTVAAAGIMACAFSISRRRLERRVKELRGELAGVREDAQKAREAERLRIASDFHDGPLQSFISLQMRLEILRKLLDRDHNSGMEDLKQLHCLAQTQVRELRAFVRSMRPMEVDGANLFAAARRIAESFEKESGVPVTFGGGGKPLAVPQGNATEILQLLSEALHNVQKHAGATRVAVAMEKVDRALEISVDDNGRGFAFSGAYNLEELELLRLGPASLKRRARSLNAEMILESHPGRGAGLKFRIPLV